MCRNYVIALGLVALTSCHSNDPLNPFANDKRVTRRNNISVDNQSDFVVEAYVSLWEGTHQEGCEGPQRFENTEQVAPHSARVVSVAMRCLKGQDWRRGRGSAHIVPPAGPNGHFSGVDIDRDKMTGDTTAVVCDNSGCKQAN